MSDSTNLIRTLSLSPHPEGGFYCHTHSHDLTVPNPFSSPSSSPSDTTRLASNSIHYLLTPTSPIGHFHRNKSVIYHFLHRGRGVYRLIHPESKAVEEFVVGGDIAGGEKIAWVVEGGVWKSSQMMEGEEGLLISEVVVPGFEFRDTEFLDWKGLRELVGEEKARKWRGFLKLEMRGEE
ncbi:hypothetical protein K440DRAFT_410120 [Wilcoxina mikolae CBS 423.85]|nr:hypothetical protein K440DRAFT_410120 [Wilcoxina mikolae CBS 423.85]